MTTADTELTQQIPAYLPPPVTIYRPPPSNGLAVAGMVLGITGMGLCFLGVFTFAQIVCAIVFSAIGLQRADLDRTLPHRGKAIAGLCCGCLAAFFYVTLGVVTHGVLFLA